MFCSLSESTRKAMTNIYHGVKDLFSFWQTPAEDNGRTTQEVDPQRIVDEAPNPGLVVDTLFHVRRSISFVPASVDPGNRYSRP